MTQALLSAQPPGAGAPRLPTLPGWCDALLSTAGSVEFFASRLWFDTLIAHAMPPGGVALPLCLGAGDILLLLRGRNDSLTSPYSLEWRPMFRAGLAPAEAERAGSELARLYRFSGPLRLEGLPPDMPEMESLLAGAESGGLAALRFRNFGNWHDALPSGQGWPEYLAARPPAMRSTIQRKLARAAREFRFERVDRPGPALEAGIGAYEAVRAGSWKPFEPFPDFDAHLMRATAATGLLRLGILRDARHGTPVAAQYWVVSGGRAHLLKLCHVEAARPASPGTALTALVIRGLIEEDFVRELDFGRGDDGYKQLWVSRRRQMWGVHLASPWHPSGLAAIARHRAAAWVRARRAAGA